MLETKVDAKTPDGAADCEFFAPGEAGKWPGVIMYTDVLGVRPVFRDMARRLVGQGFCVLLPNLFYRASRLPVYAFPPKFGDEKTVARMNEVRPAAAADLIARDVGSYVTALLSRPQAKAPEVGAVGYCMGGGIAMRTAAAAPDKVAAAASFHGSSLFTDKPDSPHLLLPMVKARLYFGFAIEDRTMPDDVVEKFKAALNAAGVKWAGEAYAGTKHGWCVKDHTVYNEAQAERAWAKTVLLFKETLV